MGKKKKESKKQPKEPNFDWLHAPKSQLENLLKNIKISDKKTKLKKDNVEKKIKLKDLEEFLEDILEGKINNRIDAAKELSKRIMADYEFLEEYNPQRNSIGKEIKDFIKDAKDIVFGALSPFEDDNTTDIPPLETEQEAAQIQQGQGLKILTPKQMITTLPILLAQLRAGNNSKKLKNEIRQFVYSLYRSKNLSKTVYNNLINTT